MLAEMNAGKRQTYLRIAKKFHTPVYVYDASVMRHRCHELLTAFPGAKMHYACKANEHPSIVALIKKEGCGIDTVSPGEIALAKACGFRKNEMSFTCSNITERELRIAAKACAEVHLDSLNQLEWWGRGQLGKEVSLRLNQGIGAGHHAHVITGGPDSKFGISLRDVPRARMIAERYGLRITGLAQHIGSNVLSVPIFARAMQKLLDTAKEFADIARLDFGGGFGIPYGPEEKPLDLARLGKEYVMRTEAFVRAHGKPVRFSFEPGRFPVAEAGTLLVSVTDLKTTSAHLFAGVDSGFNHLIRPAMYGAYHPILNLTRTGGKKEKITIAGNVCESGDLFAVDRRMPVPRIGDVLAIQNAGAYGMSMASVYNRRPLPREVLVDGKRVSLLPAPRI